MPLGKDGHDYLGQASPPARITLRRSCGSDHKVLLVAPPFVSSRYSPFCSRSLATNPVHPVWWLAPMPAPLSPWKYS